MGEGWGEAEDSSGEHPNIFVPKGEAIPNINQCEKQNFSDFLILQSYEKRNQRAAQG